MIIAHLEFPKCNGKEIIPGVFLIGEPVARPDLGENSLACLANVDGMFCLIELRAKLLEEGGN